MNELPNEIINQILLFNSHPVADLFKEAVAQVNEELYEIIEGEESCIADEMSFAEYLFYDRWRTKEYDRCFNEMMDERIFDDEGYDY